MAITDEQSIRSADALTAGLIHEMRHPLMGLKAGLHFLEQALSAETTGGDDWLLVKAQIARLEELFRRYQDFLQPERVAAGPFPAAKVLQDAVDLMHHQLRRLGSDFTLSVPAETPIAWGTPSAFTHAITNLVLNALEALGDSPGGRLAVRLRQVEAPGGPRVTVRVSDDGKGLTADEAARLFTEGFTTKSGARGSGLGLKLTRRLLGTYGGTLALTEPGDSERLPWAKTEFLLTLPTAPPKAEPVPGSPQPASAPTSLQALVVDDEPVILKLLTRTLSAEYTITTAATAEEAEALLRSRTFDLLITDKNLPGKTGVALAAVARALSQRMVILLITAFGNAESARTLLSLGIDGYLQKPFELDELSRRVRTASAVRRAVPAEPKVVARAQAQVLVHESSTEDGRRIGAALTSLGLEPVPSAGLPDLLSTQTALGMVVATALLTESLRERLWAIRAAQPDFRVVVILENQSLSECIAAMAVGATADLARPLPDPEALAAAMREALQGSRSR